MNGQNNNGRGIFYGVIGVATLVVAIIGATFAYFTATASNNNAITGDMASITMSLAVEKITNADQAKGGMIPMSNGMVEQAVSNASTKGVCVDDNGNAVCQIYEITLTNTSTAAQFVDGYVALKGGSGKPTDFDSYVTNAKFPVNGWDESTDGATLVGTTMRWAQVFQTVSYLDADGEECVKDTDGCNEVISYSTGGDQVLGATSEKMSLVAIGNTADGKNATNIKTDPNYAKNFVSDTNDKSVTINNTGDSATDGVKKRVSISSSWYDAIGINYVRVSNHAWKTDGSLETYDREDDVTSALVFNQNVGPQGGGDNVRKFYVAVWLSETGTNQTQGATVTEGSGQSATSYTNPDKTSFFAGNVTFLSAQGSEVSATFSGYVRVPNAALNSGQ